MDKLWLGWNDPGAYDKNEELKARRISGCDAAVIILGRYHKAAPRELLKRK